MAFHSRPGLPLVLLGRLQDDTECRASWRQGIAALGGGPRVDGPPPLEGVSIDSLVLGVRKALELGLADDLDWLSPAAAAVALYELSVALPTSKERTEIGRRALTRLYEGTAETFIAVATRAALGSAKMLRSAALRARVGLVMDMPAGTTVDEGPLALALVGRRELFESWVARPAIGSLPSRRLAARLLEKAAREAVTRNEQGDTYPKDLLVGAQALPVLNQLLNDREPLVWRHAAVARGLLASLDGTLREQVDLSLDPKLSPTEWRRAAVSLVACLACEPEVAVSNCRRVLRGEITELDPGVGPAMVWGLQPVLDTEPAAAEELLRELLTLPGTGVVEAAAGLLSDCALPNFGREARATVLHRLSRHAAQGDRMAGVLAKRVERDMQTDPDVPSTLTASIRAAMAAYEVRGARAAYERALEVSAIAEHTLCGLEREAPDGAPSMRSILALAELDAGVLEGARLSELLLLGRRPTERDSSLPQLDRLHERLGSWLLRGEEAIVEIERPEQVVRRERLRTLLHLVDWENACTRGETEATTVKGLADRLQRTARVLAQQLAKGAPTSLHRIVCATLARSLDAALRENVADVADALLAMAAWIEDPATLSTVASASTHPDLSSALTAYSEFLERAAHWRSQTSTPNSSGASDVARAVIDLSRRLGAGGSYRAEALRRTVVRLGRSLESIAVARGISELTSAATASGDPLAELELSADALRRLATGAARRVAGEDAADSYPPLDVAMLSVLLQRGVNSGVPATADQIARAVSALTIGLPEVFAAAITRVLARLPELPVTPASEVYAIPLQRRRIALPDWLLPRRTIGGFYVEKSLGAGGVSSVFIARRTEDRSGAAAEMFALKVPEYDPTTARSLSEQEFFDLFREEAGALLSLPQHPNLARFVTFDLASKPKPILVMELIRGPSLDRLVRSRALTTERALRYLDGILAGLESMHRVGVGHLDIKPSNIILRDGGEPVLVDFGLSGRHLRPGCGTLEYCAPEILGVAPEGSQPSPLPADLYAFACTAFEVLTGRALFDGPDENALASRHIVHDGWPDPMQALAGDVRLGAITELLASCLRRDPGARPTVPRVRAALKSAAATVDSQPWPLIASNSVPAPARSEFAAAR